MGQLGSSVEGVKQLLPLVMQTREDIDRKVSTRLACGAVCMSVGCQAYTLRDHLCTALSDVYELSYSAADQSLRVYASEELLLTTSSTSTTTTTTITTSTSPAPTTTSTSSTTSAATTTTSSTSAAPTTSSCTSLLLLPHQAHLLLLPQQHICCSYTTSTSAAPSTSGYICCSYTSTSAAPILLPQQVHLLLYHITLLLLPHQVHLCSYQQHLLLTTSQSAAPTTSSTSAAPTTSSSCSYHIKYLCCTTSSTSAAPTTSSTSAAPTTSSTSAAPTTSTTTAPAGCLTSYIANAEYVLKGPSGSIVADNSTFYVDGQDCSWRIIVDEGFLVSITWLSFSVEPSYDYVSVADPCLGSDGYAWQTYDGNSLPPDVVSTNNQMRPQKLQIVAPIRSRSETRPFVPRAQRPLSRPRLPSQAPLTSWEQTQPLGRQTNTRSPASFPPRFSFLSFSSRPMLYFLLPCLLPLSQFHDRSIAFSAYHFIYLIFSIYSPHLFASSWLQSLSIPPLLFLFFHLPPCPSPRKTLIKASLSLHLSYFFLLSSLSFPSSPLSFFFSISPSFLILRSPSHRHSPHQTQKQRTNKNYNLSTPSKGGQRHLNRPKHGEVFIFGSNFPLSPPKNAPPSAASLMKHPGRGVPSVPRPGSRTAPSKRASPLSSPSSFLQAIIFHFFSSNSFIPSLRTFPSSFSASSIFLFPSFLFLHRHFHSTTLPLFFRLLSLPFLFQSPYPFPSSLPLILFQSPSLFPSSLPPLPFSISLSLSVFSPSFSSFLSLLLPFLLHPLFYTPSKQA
ncbi:hypothetical protein C7M84_019877 [Penaeus vannamei]|uniref:CUB domain-containing protein n=1 Tax=Penaeus vannamei TaxID=6689 RepID=A0A423SDK5_PENVA|nr:hypothetical protein C7M84_019877 [Penaeus vannamei]